MRTKILALVFAQLLVVRRAARDGGDHRRGLKASAELNAGIVSFRAACGGLLWKTKSLMLAAALFLSISMPPSH
jgi:hypothetical protein